jgi:ribonuclease HI
MTYTMTIYVDGGCRRNGNVGAIGAAACVFMNRRGPWKSWVKKLPLSNPQPTNQRAELEAIILALRQGWEIYLSLDTNPYMHVTIFADSKYALGCMTQWRQKWLRNDFTNSAGNEVVNRDLIECAYELDERLANEGSVEYEWVPRADNQHADAAVNRMLDQME